jgi:hypothetical protein
MVYKMESVGCLSHRIQIAAKKITFQKNDLDTIKKVMTNYKRQQGTNAVVDTKVVLRL